jgi:hypothetical protein
MVCFAILYGAIALGEQVKLEPITDHSGASEACGPIAIRWGFMCSIGGRFNDHLYALNYTRLGDVPWDTRTPIEAPVAFWSRGKDGKWTSVLLDAPHRTYQTPTLLLGHDGRAHVFTLEPFDSSIQWFHANDPSNAAFSRTEIPIGWGSYMSGAIDQRGIVALVYWANGAGGLPAYSGSKLGCTLLNTTTGESKNFTIDSPGAPYCYNQIFFNQTGLHILSIRTEVVPGSILCGTRNHYIDLRYYYCPDPLAADPQWQHVTIMHNDRACIQPLGDIVDPSGRVHLLYNYNVDDGHGNATPWKLVYAASRAAASGAQAPEFVQHELSTPGDGRLFLTRDGAVHIIAYSGGGSAQYARVLDGVAGRFAAWKTFTPEVSLSRLFPIDARNGSTPSDDLEAIFVPSINVPQKDTLFYLSLRP